MAYIANNLSLLGNAIGGVSRFWYYWTADSISTVLGAGYISDADKHRMQIGDVVQVVSGTANTSGPAATSSTHARGTVSEFASDPSVSFMVVDSISSGAATLKEATVELGSQLGFFGATPISQPSGASQAAVATTTITNPGTTAATSGTNIGFGYTTTQQANQIAQAVTDLIAWRNDVNTLINGGLRTPLVNLGLIKGSA